MKRILFVAGVIAFTFASAQQNEFFDIQKYLKKKTIEEKKAIINPLSKILKPGCGTTGKNLLMLPNQNKVVPLLHDNRFIPKLFTIVPTNQSLPLAKLSHALSNGNKVYLLLQDNMPCIVPDMSQRNMPNISNPDEYFRSLASGNQVAGKMPNAVTPYNIIIPPTK